jgi:type IV pilus assembly protein PilX
MALIASLLLLLVVTIMAVSMFRSFGMQEKISGNLREKQRALNAAVSAQQYAEWYLSSGTAPPTAACGAPLLPAANAQVCNNAINAAGDYTIVPWTIGATFTPFTANLINGAANVVSTLPTFTGTGINKADSYYQTPTFYITDMGALAAGGGEVYQIDALGYGGTPSAVAVVESTFLLTNNTAKNPDK